MAIVSLLSVTVFSEAVIPPGRLDVTLFIPLCLKMSYFGMAHAENGNRRPTCGNLFPLQGSPINWALMVLTRFRSIEH